MVNKFKRINISLDQNLADAFDKYARDSGLKKSAILRNFIKSYDGKLVPTTYIEKDNKTTYNFKIEEDLYDHVLTLAKKHLTSTSGVIRLIIANNINLETVDLLGQSKLFNERFETFNILNLKTQDLDRTMELLKRYAEVKNQKGFNFSSIKTFAQKKELEKTSNLLHQVLGLVMNLFLADKSKLNINLIESGINDAIKIQNKYEVLIKHYETSIEYHDIENPFFSKEKSNLNSYHENLMHISVGRFENAEYLADFHSSALIKMGELAGRLVNLDQEELKIMCIGPGAFPGIFYSLLGLSKLIEESRFSKIQIDIYDPCLLETTYKNEKYINNSDLMDKEVNVRINDAIHKVSLKDHVKSLGLESRVEFNFQKVELKGKKGTYLGIHNLVSDLISQNKIYDVNLIYSVETIHDLPEALKVFREFNASSVVGASHMIFSGDEAPKIYQQGDNKRIERKVFSMAMRKIQQFLIQTNMDKFWLPIILRPDLNNELNKFFIEENTENKYKEIINNKGLYFETMPLETHTLESPFGCLTFGMRKAKFLMKKETSIFEKGKTIDYQCSVAVTKI